jgi:5'-deoxynucleotidase YfbR-like HD superfamily hydrolase
VAEHSYYVAVYAMLLGRGMGHHEWIVNEAIRMALIHDTEEIVTGDIPAPAKKYLDPDDKKFLNFKNRAHELLKIRASGMPNEISVHIVKLADFMDALAYLATEIQMGNQSVLKILQEIRIRAELLIKEMDQRNMLGRWDLPSMMSMLSNFIEDHRNGLSNTLVHPAARGPFDK